MKTGNIKERQNAKEQPQYRGAWIAGPGNPSPNGILGGFHLAALPQALDPAGHNMEVIVISSKDPAKIVGKVRPGRRLFFTFYQDG